MTLLLASVLLRKIMVQSNRTTYCDNNNQVNITNSIFQFDMRDIKGNLVTLNNVKGKSAIIVVNVASQ